ncbi:acetyl-CoA carboxylase biotin carboxyl carrier protein subunit [Puteibacter caeruleilacunae]|nr:acetyl-CoA carboxylase biotin carboxyl carrier protein subunit [Puteibacter caeruleilacunae]
MSKDQKTKTYVVTGDHTFTLNTKDYQVIPADNQHQFLRIKHHNDECMVEYEGQRFTGEIVELKQNKCTVTINGNTYNFTIDTEASFERKEKLIQRNQYNNKITIKAPMPGVINEVLVAEGSTIEKGVPLLILEAMKMQNQILNTKSGVATRVLVKAGESVMANQPLIEIE